MTMLPKFKRLTCALIFSFNVGCMFASLCADSQRLPFFIFRWITDLNVLFRGHPHGSIGGNIIYVGLALVAALPTFWLYERLAVYKPLTATILLGVTAVGSSPVCWIFDRIMAEAQWSRWLLVEALLMVVWAVLVDARRTSFSTASRALIVALHFGFWGWIYIYTDGPVTRFTVLFISAAAAVSWVCGAIRDKDSAGSLFPGNSKPHTTFSVI